MYVVCFEKDSLLVIKRNDFFRENW